MLHCCFHFVLLQLKFMGIGVKVPDEQLTRERVTGLLAKIVLDETAILTNPLEHLPN